MKQLALSAALAAASLLAPAPVRAAPMTYEAVAGCPPRADVEATFTAHAVLAPGTRARIAITPGYVGRLELTTAQGRITSRQIEASSCTQVVRALALSASMAADPGGAEEAPAAPEKGLVAAETPPEVGGDGGAADPPTQQPKSQLVLRGALSGGLAWGAAPGALFVGGPSVDLVAEPPTPFQLRPSARLGILHGAASTFEGGNGSTTFSTTSARFDTCLGTSFDARAALHVAACVQWEAGAWRVEARDILNATAVTRPWISGGGLVRVELALGRLFFVEAEAGVRRPFVRDRIVVRPDVLVFRPPEQAFQTGITIGARL